MKKLMMLAVLALGTSVMVNAQTTPVNGLTKTEIKQLKKAEHKAEKAQSKEAKKAEAKK